MMDAELLQTALEAARGYIRESEGCSGYCEARCEPAERAMCRAHPVLGLMQRVLMDMRDSDLEVRVALERLVAAVVQHERHYSVIVRRGLGPALEEAQKVLTR